MTSTTRRVAVMVRLIGGPTLVIEVGGLRLLTDPISERPGPFASGPVDVVLLSHDQHDDTLDSSGRELLAQAPLVLTTSDCSERLGRSARALPPWYHLSLPRPDGGELRITGVPAQHEPGGTTHLIGESTGFVLSGVDTPTVYVSGDNASLDVVEEVAQRCAPIDIAVLSAGAERTPPADGHLTLTSDQTARAAAILGSPTVIPAHAEGRDRCTENIDDVRAAFARHGLSDRLRVLAAGETATF
jgi:L-ascorbate metabolism protein UlaG (beta-lactamase superfamily)